MLHRHVVLRDRDEARQPRLGGQQVVVRRIRACAIGAGSRSRTACARDRTGSGSPSPSRSSSALVAPATRSRDAQLRLRARRREREARLPQRDEVAGEVAAVHRARCTPARGRAGRAGRTSCRSGRGSARIRSSDGTRARAARSSRPSVMKPRSCALTVASSCRPMLVGEVRIATTGSGLLEVVGREPVRLRGRRTARRTASAARA